MSADEEYERRQEALRKELDSEEVVIIPRERRTMLEAPKRTFDEYSFSLAIRNDGGVTIRDCVLAVSNSAPFEVTASGQRVGSKPHYFDFAAKNAVRRTSTGGPRASEHEMRSEARLHPEQIIAFPGADFVARPLAGSRGLDCTLEWRLYLDNAPTSSGTIRLPRESAVQESKPARSA